MRSFIDKHGKLIEINGMTHSVYANLHETSLKKMYKQGFVRILSYDNTLAIDFDTINGRQERAIRRILKQDKFYTVIMRDSEINRFARPIRTINFN